MIIYRNTKGGFTQDVRDNLIADKIENAFFEHCIAHNNDAEYRSWANSMQYMCNVLDDREIDDDCRVAIEYQIPLTSKRIDFLIAGADDEGQKNVVVVELKQWETSEITQRPDIVMTYTAGANRAVAHPSYQAYSYTKIIENFNTAVSDGQIRLIPCAYLHNYKEEFRSSICSEFYHDALSLAPVFLRTDGPELRKFIKKHIRRNTEEDLLFAIENGKLRPSKSLQDTLSSMIRGNQEFWLIDEQKVAYETIYKAVQHVLKRKQSGLEEKYTFIIQGGPGTGKSVIAIQLLASLIRDDYAAMYVTKNAAPRNVYFAKLRQDKHKLNYIKSLLTGSGSFVDTPANTFDCLLADEAHRLQMKSGIFRNKGEAQVKEIINAARVSVFFIDEEQKVTTMDEASIPMIRKYARELGSRIVEGPEFNLQSQFRCNGSDGYMAFVSALLGYRQAPNAALDMDYDFRIFSSPVELREALREKNRIANKARMLAGYCYPWNSQKDTTQIDIRLRDGFEAQWNFADTGTWAIDPDSFDQVGCIHTSQGLEFDYVGLIIGRDLYYADGRVQTDPSARASSDHSLAGWRQRGGLPLADLIIRNTYRTLLTRGQKGCYVYCEDEALAQHMQQVLDQIKPSATPSPCPQICEQEAELPYLDEVPEEEKYVSYFPLYTIRAACGRFGHLEPVEQLGWMPVSGHHAKDRTLFVVQAKGRSMEDRIHDGDYCLFRFAGGGSKAGKIVLAEQFGETDDAYEGSYTIKQYRSFKKYAEDGSWSHEKIVLHSFNPYFEDITLDPSSSDDFRIIGELVEVIG